MQSEHTGGGLFPPCSSWMPENLAKSKHNSTEVLACQESSEQPTKRRPVSALFVIECRKQIAKLSYKIWEVLAGVGRSGLSGSDSESTETVHPKVLALFCIWAVLSELSEMVLDTCCTDRHKACEQGSEAQKEHEKKAQVLQVQIWADAALLFYSQRNMLKVLGVRWEQ